MARLAVAWVLLLLATVQGTDEVCELSHSAGGCASPTSASLVQVGRAAVDDDGDSADAGNTDGTGAGDESESAHVSRSGKPQYSTTTTSSIASGAKSIVPFGREDTAKELQMHAARTQDTLVDAVENAEVAEIKRAVFRSLTRLRAAEIKEFDTIARLETQAIDEYNDNHHFRKENPLDYIHAAEKPVGHDKMSSFHP